MTTTTPRTRRQLREALEQSRANELDLDAKLREASVKKGENTRLRTDLAGAETKLHALGYERSVTGSLGVDLGLIRPTEEWRPKKGFTPITQETLLAAVAEARKGAHDQALRTVIEALEIPGYAAGGYIPKGPTVYDTARFWNDLTTALQVRDTRAAEAERAATEAKVAKLGRRESTIFTLGDTTGFDTAFPRVTDLLKRDDAFWLNLTSNPGAAGSSYGSATRLPKPAAAKKPAKKKSTKGGQK